MKPIDFPEANKIFAKDQPEYMPLPAFMDENGVVVTCWELTDADIERIFKSKKLFISLLTYNKPLQPILPSTIPPFAPKDIPKTEESKTNTSGD